jgi:hypothetical protein
MSKIEQLAALFETGKPVTATDINRIGLANATDAIFRLRKQGYCIYTNKTSTGTSYRMGKPTKAMLAVLFETFGSSMYDKTFVMKD